MDSILLRKKGHGVYASEEIRVFPGGWQKVIKKIFGQLLLEEPTISSKRVQEFFYGLEKLEEGIAEYDFWTKVIQLMVENEVLDELDLEKLKKWEILYFIKECFPMRFQFRVAISGAIIDNPTRKSWDFEILLWFNPDAVETNPERQNFSPQVMEKLLNDDGNLDDGAYSLTIPILSDTSLPRIEKVSRQLNLHLEGR